ncbi:MAG: ATP-dependent RNA helicase HrpA [Phycisphaeraceae bacterium]|nr:ATP-dependent RNA helicase HrpA [Phycisphaeraceae bacterium]
MARTVFPLLADPGGYVACAMDLREDAGKREYWLQLFRGHFDKLCQEARTEAADRGEAPAVTEDKVTQARQEFLAYLQAIEDNPDAVGRLDINTICLARQKALIAAGLSDPYRLAKKKETQAALGLLPGLLSELDRLPAHARAESVIRGVFAGNIFDLGAVSTLELFRQGPVDVLAVREKLKPRPWLRDDLDAWLRRQKQGPAYRSAVLFVDNAGPDVVLGMLPLARELLRRGTSVILTANTLPALNDVTHEELTEIMAEVRKFDEIFAQALASGKLELAPSGNGSPLIDLSTVSEELAKAVKRNRCDLVVLEGMGRAVESNLEAHFACDALKIAMIKDQGVAKSLGGEVYDLVMRFDEIKKKKMVKPGGRVQREAGDDRQNKGQQQRAARQILVTYPQDLPIAGKRGEIAAAIAANQVVVICGDTGSGKSTQLPKICLEMGRGIKGLIGHTQPRRIAARALAGRIAQELGTSLGDVVGYKIRFTDTTGPACRIKLMTDGILLAETQHDRQLRRYDTLLIDEAHERSLNIDFLLGYLKRLLPKRPDLKVIITSATIDPRKFAEHFATARGPSPIVEISGRTYPVEVRYRPLRAEVPGAGETGGEEEESGQEQALLDAVAELMTEDRGDILVFLPTERDILETAKVLRGRYLRGAHAARSPGRGISSGGTGGGGVEILPLYARLPTGEQNRVFEPHGGRRIVLATNVAETSLTVPGIKHVVDVGTARISRYSARAKVQRLPIEAISRASADQRKGRCGRTSAGVCVRLYSEEDYLSREPFTPPEVLRSNLAGVILQMKALGLGRIEDFPFLDSPRMGTVREGYRTLHELGAIDQREQLTHLGRQLARLPIDPRLGRMLLAADKENCLAEVLVIVAGLSIQDPRMRPAEQAESADKAQEQFRHARSDFLSLLKLWDAYHEWMGKLSRSRLQKACSQNFLSYPRMREWLDVYRQLRTLVEETGLRVGQREEKVESREEKGQKKQAAIFDRPLNGEDHLPLADARELSLPGAVSLPGAGDLPGVHRALLAGLLSNIAQKGEQYEYRGTEGKRVFLFPGSVLFSQKPGWVMAAEIVETTRLYARTLAEISPQWVEALAGHLVTRTHSEPHWDRQAGSVMAFEKVSLYGLTIVPRRRVSFGRVDGVKAREMFIRNALVDEDFDSDADFFLHNRQLREEIQKLEARIRRADLLADEQMRFNFYDARLPKEVHSGGTLSHWLKAVRREQPQALFMTREDLLKGSVEEVTEQAYPQRIESGGMKLPLSYKLSLGEPDDGVTVTIPVEAVPQLDVKRLGWLVPGMLKEKIAALIRTLPKDLRRNFIPVPEYAQRVLEALRIGGGTLNAAVARAMTELAGIPVREEDFREEDLPGYLRMYVRVVDKEGKALAEGRDAAEVRQKVGPLAAAGLADLMGGPAGEEAGTARGGLEKKGVRKWDFGDLPESVEVTRGGVILRAYPGLVDEGDSVAVRLFVSQDAARWGEGRGGLRRLLALQVQAAIKSQVESMGQLQAMLRLYASLGRPEDLKKQLEDLIVDRAYLSDEPEIRRAQEFEERLSAGWVRIGDAGAEVERRVEQILQAYHKAALAIVKISEGGNRKGTLAQGPSFAREIEQQMEHLMGGRFLVDTPWVWLGHYPRYLAGIERRLEKIRAGKAARDQAMAAEFAAWWTRYGTAAKAMREQSRFDPVLTDFRWLLEEYRVSLFAQELGTAVPVSAKRLEVQWAKVGG